MVNGINLAHGDQDASGNQAPINVKHVVVFLHRSHCHVLVLCSSLFLQLRLDCQEGANCDQIEGQSQIRNVDLAQSVYEGRAQKAAENERIVVLQRKY